VTRQVLLVASHESRGVPQESALPAAAFKLGDQRVVLLNLSRILPLILLAILPPRYVGKDIVGRRPATVATCLVCTSSMGNTDQSILCGGANAMPASYTDANAHPTANCATLHAGYISWYSGCSVHHGVRDKQGCCAVCEHEKMEGRFYPAIPHTEKNGYRGS
jgi:hypothetical protein